MNNKKSVIGMLENPFLRFFRSEVTVSIFMPAAVIVALLWANSNLLNKLPEQWLYK